MKSGLKIGVVCHYSLKPERIGGMDRFFVEYDKAFKEQGYKVDWYFSDGLTHKFYEGMSIHTVKGMSAEELFLLKNSEDIRYDVIVTHFVQLCTPFFKKIKTHHKAYIIAVDHNPRPPEGFPIKKRIKKRIKGMLYGRYIDEFVGVSRYTVEAIINDFGRVVSNKTSLVYNGIAHQEYRKRTEENFGKMIVASHLRASKGIQDLIEAVRQLSPDLRDKLVIDIYGEGRMEQELKEMVKRHGLEEQISFLGSTSALPELFQNYSFMLQPTYMECFSLSILESLAANVPVITTSVGGNPEIISHRENGYIFKAGDISELTRILEKILREEIKIEAAVDKLIRREYSLEKMVKGHLKLLPCI